ncbi:MAG: sugar isomerase [Erysipelotrichaceae bacterium]|jgi:fructoselysine-6-P-deglycase FrlB-like protein|nr:sugar isomerase [Erysipelotrichaceae bacterium]
MITLLDCIERIPAIHQDILNQRPQRFKDLGDYVKNKDIHAIVFIGSGTSNTSAITACRFVENVSGLSTYTLLPNEFLRKKDYPKDALYCFVSQTGTSTLTNQALALAKDKGLWSVCFTGDEDNKLAKASEVHVNIGCGYEEFGQRTIGYHATVFSIMLAGLQIGLVNGNLSKAAFDDYLNQAAALPASHKALSAKAVDWFDANKDKLMSFDSFALYGADALWGVALEGALKILELARRHLCVGYEMDDGMHGPTLGFTSKIGVIILDDGEHDQKLSKGLAAFTKNEHQSGFVVGANTVDDTDFAFAAASGAFKALEYAPLVQVLAYRLAVDANVPVIAIKDHKEADKEEKYFNTHDEELA